MMPAISDQDMNAMLAEESRVSLLYLILPSFKSVFFNRFKSENTYWHSLENYVSILLFGKLHLLQDNCLLKNTCVHRINL